MHQQRISRAVVARFYAHSGPSAAIEAAKARPGKSICKVDQFKVKMQMLKKLIKLYFYELLCKNSDQTWFPVDQHLQSTRGS